MEGLEGHGDVEEEFRSCCGDEEWQDTEECLAEFSSSSDDDDDDEEEDDADADDDDLSSDGDVDESAMRVFFKGVSVCPENGGGSGSNKASGIGVVMERANGDSVLQVQKKLDFFVDVLVAEHLALLDGLIEALRNGVQRIVAFTDSEEVYHQIAEAEPHEEQLLVALGYRILELANKFEDFALKLVCRYELERPLRLAQEAVGIITCHQSLKRAAKEVCCPFPNCSVLLSPGECSSSILSPGECSSSRASSSNQSDINCVECQECRRLVCTSCGVPWHSSMSCEEYQSLPLEERVAGDVNLLRLAQNNNWSHCQQCRRLVDLVQGCYHVTCWCGHEFCYSCGAGYHDGAQTCQCAFWDDRYDGNNSELPTPSNHETDQWRWEPFNILPSITDGYSEQERAQLALVQRFLTGGFSLSDDHHLSHCQSPPRCSDSYLDTIKDLNQLPWLERFVSVISDSYHEDYIQ